jgi:hypothetical protein
VEIDIGNSQALDRQRRQKHCYHARDYTAVCSLHPGLQVLNHKTHSGLTKHMCTYQTPIPNMGMCNCADGHMQSNSSAEVLDLDLICPGLMF